MSKQIEPLSVIIPTYNSPDLVAQCVGSIGLTRLSYPVDVIVVNNGHPNSLDNIGNEDWFRVIQTGGKNLGWEGGLNEGLKHTNSEFVMFLNDDTFVPQAQANWIRTMMENFVMPEVAAVGPSTNIVMGPQNMAFRTPHNRLGVSYLIGFCVVLRRKVLDEVGGVDEMLPGGDDLDLSIRIRKAGYTLVACRDVYIHHHGFQTGAKIHGGPTSRNGWNSQERIEKTNLALIKKHGFKEWFKCLYGYSYPGLFKGDDHEGDIVRTYVCGEKILELGCGNNKTVPNAIGVDIVPNGTNILTLNGISQADINANVEEDIPINDESQDTIIARHILEHCTDTVKTMNLWKRKLKKDGRLIVAVPNESIMKSIPMNIEHVHAFTPESLNTLAELIGLKRTNLQTTNSGSFVSVFCRNGEFHEA